MQGDVVYLRSTNRHVMLCGGWRFILPAYCQSVWNILGARIGYLKHAPRCPLSCRFPLSWRVSR